MHAKKKIIHLNYILATYKKNLTRHLEFLGNFMFCQRKAWVLNWSRQNNNLPETPLVTLKCSFPH